MDAMNGPKETTRVTAPVASTTNVNVFTAPGKAMVGERPRPFGEAVGFDPITSTLIFGDYDAVLVDAMMTVAEACGAEPGDCCRRSQEARRARLSRCDPRHQAVPAGLRSGAENRDVRPGAVRSDDGAIPALGSESVVVDVRISAVMTHIKR
jgi:hypothetical protein